MTDEHPKAQSHAPSTQQDVARLAGVHRGTVSRAMDPARRDLLDSKTLARVLSAAERLAYRPNALARGLKTMRSRVTGLIAPALSNPDVATIIDAYETKLSEAGYATMVMSSGDNADALAAAGSRLMASRAEGIVIITAKSTDFVMEALEVNDTPKVVVGAAHEGVSTVSVDHRLGAELTVAHLIRLGHARIGLIAETGSSTRGAAHRAGYAAALRRVELELDEGLIEIAEPTRPASGGEACAALFHRGGAPTAIFATSDETALGCYASLADLGLRVPSDVSVVGYGNSSYGRYVSPALTTVSLPLAAAGNEAAMLILEQIGEGAPRDLRQVQLKPYLLQRLSSARPA